MGTPMFSSVLTLRIQLSNICASVEGDLEGRKEMATVGGAFLCTATASHALCWAPKALGPLRG